MQVLLVEDDLPLADALRRGLEEEGHAVAITSDGLSGFRCALQQAFDVIVLDVLLPVMDGFTVARKLREKLNRTPILMLTARDEECDVIYGLDAGADDYVTKPCSFELLLARLRALTRRGPITRSIHVQLGDLTLDETSREVIRGGRRIPLTPTEFSLLGLLLRRARSVVPRSVIIQEVWGFDADIGDGNLDAFVHSLRRKIDGPTGPKLLHTIRGIGYCVREPEG